MSTTCQTSSVKLVRPALPAIGATLADLRAYCDAMLAFGLAVYANPASCPTPLDTEDRRNRFRDSLGFLDHVIAGRCERDPALNAAYEALFPPHRHDEDFFDKMSRITVTSSNGEALAFTLSPARSAPEENDNRPLQEIEAEYIGWFLREAIAKAFTAIADMLHAEVACNRLIDLVLSDSDGARPLEAFLDDIAFSGAFTILQGGDGRKVGKTSSPRYVAVVNNPTWRTLLGCADAAVETTRDFHHKYLEAIQIGNSTEPMTGNRRMFLDFGS